MKTKILLTYALLFVSISICSAQSTVVKSENTAGTSEEISSEETSSEKTKPIKSSFLSVGANFSNLSGSNADSKTGLSIAMGYHENDIDNGTISTIYATYTCMGNQIDYSGSALKTNLEYIGLGWDVVYRTTTNLYLGYGMGYDFLVSSKYSYNGQTMDIDDLNGFDMNLSLIARYNFSDKIFIAARYKFGFFPVVGDIDKFMGDSSNRCLTASIGIVF